MFERMLFIYPNILFLLKGVVSKQTKYKEKEVKKLGLKKIINFFIKIVSRRILYHKVDKWAREGKE